MKTKQVETKKKSWSEINRIRKEERKSWKETALVKKLEKEKKKTTVIAPSVPVVTSKAYSTISIAVPGSILDNAQSAELRTYLAGQIARAMCLFQIDEVIVFDDCGDQTNSKKGSIEDTQGVKTAPQCCIQLGRILQFLECPQYLRKSFFPLHPDLKNAGILNPLNAPHHLSIHDDFEFREGVVSNKPVKQGKGSLVNVGLLQEVQVDKLLTPGLRCTVRIFPQEPECKKLKGVIVSPTTPRAETGVYWGYNVRIANSLSQVFSQCPYAEGYDLSIGTSDKGTSIDDFECPKYKHLLIMFGGLHGLESALENDMLLEEEDPKLLFDSYLNTLPEQGSKTIRTEEAILISMAALRPKLNPEVCARTAEENNVNTNIDSE